MHPTGPCHVQQWGQSAGSEQEDTHLCLRSVIVLRSIHYFSTKFQSLNLYSCCLYIHTYTYLKCIYFGAILQPLLCIPFEIWKHRFMTHSAASMAVQRNRSTSHSLGSQAKALLLLFLIMVTSGLINSAIAAKVGSPPPRPPPRPPAATIISPSPTPAGWWIKNVINTKWCFLNIYFFHLLDDLKQLSAISSPVHIFRTFPSRSVDR